MARSALWRDRSCPSERYVEKLKTGVALIPRSGQSVSKDTNTGVWEKSENAVVRLALALKAMKKKEVLRCQKCCYRSRRGDLVWGMFSMTNIAIAQVFLVREFNL